MATVNKKILCKLNMELKKEGSMSKEIYKAFIESRKDEIVIINIGTDRCTGDSFAPLIGTLLEEKNTCIKVYGTLDNPIHAKNLEYEVDKIYKAHPNAFILSIDACLGKKEEVGKIYLRDKPLVPGLALGKDLISVGDYSIVGIVNLDTNGVNFIVMQSTRLSVVRKLAIKVVDEIMMLNLNYVVKDNSEHKIVHEVV